MVESDVLSKDDVGAVFKWLRDEVGLNLRAVVDTAGEIIARLVRVPKKAVLRRSWKLSCHSSAVDAGCSRARNHAVCLGRCGTGKYTGRSSSIKHRRRAPPKYPAEVLPLPELYYFGHNKPFGARPHTAATRRSTRKSVDVELKARRLFLRRAEEPAEVLSEGAEAKRAVQLQHDVGYAGRWPATQPVTTPCSADRFWSRSPRSSSNRRQATGMPSAD